MVWWYFWCFFSICFWFGGMSIKLVVYVKSFWYLWWVGGMCGGLVVSVVGWWYLWLVWWYLWCFVVFVVGWWYVWWWVLACWCIWCRGIWCSEFLQIRCIGGGGIGRGALLQLLYITAGLQGWSQYKVVHYRVGHCTWLYTIHGCRLYMVVHYRVGHYTWLYSLADSSSPL